MMRIKLDRSFCGHTIASRTSQVKFFLLFQEGAAPAVPNRLASATFR